MPGEAIEPTLLLDTRVFQVLQDGSARRYRENGMLGTGLSRGKELGAMQPNLLIATLAACWMPLSVVAQAGSALSNATSAPSSGYDQPPKNILEVMHAPSPPIPAVSPTQDDILLVSWQDYPSISRVATPFLRLAGARIEAGNHSKHDTPGGYGITPCVRDFELVHVADGARIHVALPAGTCPNLPVWSADGKRFAFENIATGAVELWIGDAKTGKVRPVPGAHLNPMFEQEIQWMPDQRMLLVKLVPVGIGLPPPEPKVPSGPSIQETGGEKKGRAAPMRTATRLPASMTRTSLIITPVHN